MIKKYFLIISLFICFNLNAAEIKIISDKPGDGKKIVYHSWVQIEYTGLFENGKIFDTNVGKNRPLVVQMGMKEVIPGFEQGIMGTTKGTKRKIKIPAELAYGEKGGGEVIPPNTDLIFEFEIIDVLDPHYKIINSEELIEQINNNAVALDIRLANQWEKGVIKGTFQETAFNKDGKFNVYLMDKVRALAAEESQNIEIIFISQDGKTAAILGNAFAEDLGFTNVLLNIFKIRVKINQTVDEIIKFNPDILFSIDSPDFTLRVAERVKKINTNIKTIHYVAPQVWVWRKNRVKKIKKFIDHMLLLFNFEKKYFEEENIKNTFVGHPLIENIKKSQTIIENILWHHIII